MAPKADGDLAAQFKANVALAALRGDKSIEALAGEFNLEPEQIDAWKNQLVRHASAAFLVAERGEEAAARPPRQEQALRPAPTLRKVPTLGQPTVPQWPARPRVAALRAVPAPAAPDPSDARDDLWEDLVTQASAGDTGSRAAADATAPASSARRSRVSAWRRRLMGGLMVTWRERHHAARISRQMMRLYRKVAADHPGARKAELYRYVMAARLGGTLTAADAVLEQAAQSFAEWPVARALTFRDVVHYVAVSDYLASYDDVAQWTRDNLGRKVASLVPDYL